MGASRAISADMRDGHETLRLLLQPPRILCASTGRYPHLPSLEAVQPTTARVPWSRDNFPGRTHGTPQAVAMSCWPLPLQAHPTFRTPPSPQPERARAPESAAPLTLSCLGEEQMPEGNLHAEAGPNTKQNPRSCVNKEKKGKFLHEPQEQWIKSPQSTWCTLHQWNTWIDNESSQNWGGGLWEQL